MKPLLVPILFGLIMSVPWSVQASDGADALERRQQALKQEQTRPAGNEDSTARAAKAQKQKPSLAS
ncbi:hypothetical protein V3H56_13640 [Pseudomonas sp. MS646]|uniref:hypothetical protein n=1 Tax=Pseudomonas sp. MS646 TaxID=3118751 RepID=UPI0030CA6583